MAAANAPRNTKQPMATAPASTASSAGRGALGALGRSRTSIAWKMSRSLFRAAACNPSTLRSNANLAFVCEYKYMRASEYLSSRVMSTTMFRCGSTAYRYKSVLKLDCQVPLVLHKWFLWVLCSKDMNYSICGCRSTSFKY